MNIDAIRNGIVIDHITAGKAMQVYNMLNLDKLDCQVAIIRKHAHGNKRHYQNCIRQGSRSRCSELRLSHGNDKCNP